MFPALSAAIPLGWLNRALLPKPFVAPGVALPASVRMGRLCACAPAAAASVSAPAAASLKKNGFIGSVPVWAIHDAVGIRPAAALDQSRERVVGTRASCRQAQNVGRLN